MSVYSDISSSKKDFLIKVSFIALSVIVFCNMNAMLAMIFGVKSILTPIIMLLTLVLIFRSIFYNTSMRSHLILNYTVLFILAYIFIAFFSIVVFPENLHPNSSLIKLFRNYFSSILVISGFYFGCIYVLDKLGIGMLLKMLLILFVFTCCFTSFLAVKSAGELLSEAGSGLESERHAGLFGNPNEAGNFGAFCLVIVLASSLYFKKNKLFIFLLSSLAFYSIFVSFSKAAILVGVLVIVFFILFNLKNIFSIGKTNRKLFALALSAFMVSCVLIVFNWNNIFNSFSQGQQKRALSFFLLIQGEVSKKTTSDRTIVFAQGWELIKKSPVIGNGFGSFHRFAKGELKLGVHNTFLLLQGEGGILILALYFGLLMLLFYYGIKIRNHGIRFLVLGFTLVFFISVSGAGHNAMYDRVANGLLGICIALIAKRNNY